MRDVPHGAELRLTVDGDLWWSRVYETIELLAEAEAKRAQIRSEGVDPAGAATIGRIAMNDNNLLTRSAVE